MVFSHRLTTSPKGYCSEPSHYGAHGFKQMRARKLSPRKPTSFAKYGVTSQWSGITV